MKGKYAKKKNNPGFPWILIGVIVIVVCAVVMWTLPGDQDSVDPDRSETTQSPEGTAGETSPVPENTVSLDILMPEESFQPINLDYGVFIDRIGSYSGTYMEDGSDQLVSGVMMIRISNTGDEDLQLMNIEVGYPGESRYFKVTNLPAGASAVLLELEQKKMPAEQPVSAVASNVVLFQEKMQADFSVFEASGANGALNIKNISEEDITGDIYVYYKYKSQDLYYGGITFRVEIKGGLKAGEIRQIMTSHYNPESCEIVMIDVIQRDGN